MRVGECGLLQISCECIRAECARVCELSLSLIQPINQPSARRATLLITPSPSCRDERWTNMYEVDCAAAFYLVLHSAGGLHIL